MFNLALAGPDYVLEKRSRRGAKLWRIDCAIPLYSQKITSQRSANEISDSGRLRIER